MEILIKNDKVINKEIDGEMILLNSETGECIGLNEIGADIWLELSDCNKSEQVVQRLMEIYEVEETVLEADINEFIDELINRSMIKVEAIE